VTLTTKREDLNMNIQIYGVSKCFDTKKAQRYFKERNIKFQLIDLNIIGLGKRELQNVKQAVGLKNLIDKASNAYKKLNIEHIINDSVKEEILLNNPTLYKTPIVRNGKNATVGYEPEVWKTWE
jgi:arsenate reductase